MQRVGRVGATLVAFAAAVVLLGWYVDLPGSSLIRGSTPMRPNTAGCLLVLGIAVAALEKRRLLLPLAAAVAAVGALSLLERVLDRSFGVDHLLPGIDLGGVDPRMAPATATALLLLAVAATVGGLGRGSAMRGLSTAALVVSQVAILGYAYGVPSLYALGSDTTMSWRTAVCLAVVALALLLRDTTAGLVGLFTDTGSAGRVLRPLAPYLLFGPSLLGWVYVKAYSEGWFDVRYGVALLAMALTAFGAALCWRVGARLREVDEQRHAANQALDETNRTLGAAVTERTRELNDRQSFTDALLEVVEVGIVSCDAEGGNWVRNRAQRVMMGLDAADLGRLDSDEVAARLDLLGADGERLPLESYPVLQALRGEDPAPMEVLFGPAGGPYREVVADSSQILGADGAVLGAVCAITDVSSERAATRALTAEHRALTEAQRLARLGSFTYDAADESWTYSEQLLRNWGLPEGSDLAAAAVTMIHHDDTAIVDEHWHRVLTEGGHVQYHHRILRPDGELRHLRTDLESVQNGEGGAPVVHGTQMDVTELKLAEEAAQRATVFFDAVLTATPDYTFVATLATGKLIYASRHEDVLLGAGTQHLEALEPRAIDRLVHPEDQVRVRAINTAAADLEDGHVVQLVYRGMHRDGDWRWLSRRLTPFRRDESGDVVEVLGVVRDVSDLKDAEDALTHAALHDSLTGLPNRALLVDRLDAALARASHDGREIAVLFCDLDGFKRVNDTAGHAAGDAVLLEISGRLSNALRDDDTVGRVGGDEFVVVVQPWNRAKAGDPSGSTPSDPAGDRALAVQVAERIAEAVRVPVTVNGAEHVVTVSIGITYARPTAAGRAGSVTADQVLQDADAAMYLAKGRGKDGFAVFERGLRTDLVQRGRIEQVLRQALHAHSATDGGSRAPATARGPRLTAAYQPVFASGTMTLTGFEALARLTGADGVEIAPDLFIPIAEQTGTIYRLGTVMLGLACAQLQSWRAETSGLENVTMAVNVSALQAQHSALGDDVRHALSAHGLAPSDLVLELTESALLEAAHSTIATLHALRAAGVGIAIDDFGTGYASLRYVATLPVTIVKIEKSFTAGLPHDATSRKIVKAVAGLAADLDLACIVEGVSTIQQLDALPAGVHIQGFLTGAPQLATDIDITRFLAETLARARA